VNGWAFASEAEAMARHRCRSWTFSIRLSESAAAFGQALELRRDLAKADPQAYRSTVADTLDNQGALYTDMQRLPEAANTFPQALQIRLDLSQVNPQEYKPALAATLNNQGFLFIRMKWLSEPPMHSHCWSIMEPL
jgi:tetratricopeptide (TPR) repeat protein